MPSPISISGMKVLDEITAGLPANSAQRRAVAELKAEIENLQAKTVKLEQQLAAQNLKPDLTAEAVRILQGLVSADGLPLTADVFAEAAVSEINNSKNHFAGLLELGFVQIYERAPMAGRNRPEEFVITDKGRAYLLEKGLLPKTS